MAQVGKTAVVGLAMMIMLVSGGLGASIPSEAASSPPCPFSATTARGSFLATNSLPAPLNPCPGYEWAKTFGHPAPGERAYGLSVDVTSDNGEVLLAHSVADGLQVVIVIRLDANGTVIWQKEFSGLGTNGGGIQQTSDGGFAFATAGPEGLGSYDAVVTRLDPLGGVLWQRAYGGSALDDARHIEETSDGGFIVGGNTYSFGAGGKDLWLLLLDPAGGLVWQQTYGSAADECFYGVSPTIDGGFVATGQTNCNGEGNPEALILRLDSGGAIVWQKSLRGSGFSSPPNGIRPTADGGFVVSMSAGYKWAIVKLSSAGAISWQRTYGSIGVFRGSILPLAGGGYVASASISTRTSGFDLVVLRIDDAGNAVWQRSYGGLGWDYPCILGCLGEAPDGNLLVAGTTTSFTNDQGAAWLLRLFSDGSISSTCAPGFGTRTTSPSMALGKLKAVEASFGASTAPISSANLAGSGSPGGLSVETQCSA